MKKIFALALATLLALNAFGQQKKCDTRYPYNTDDALVPQYTVPDALVLENGKKVRSAKVWEAQRRAEILKVFTDEMYGQMPGRPEDLRFELKRSEPAYGGMAVRKRVQIYYGPSQENSFELLLQVPAVRKGPAPVFVGLNFYGNDATLEGPNAYRWQHEMALRSGFAVATAWHEEVDPDWQLSRDRGVRRYYSSKGEDWSWGALSAWSWAISRIVDYLETDSDVDAAKVAVLGQSRNGKVALWSGANDERIALVISNCSGCCGAAMTRRVYGENFNAIASQFPYWFCDNFYKYKNSDAAFPMEQYEMAALIAPRPLYIASAERDYWADPEGEWLTAVNVSKVYEKIYHLKGISSKDKMPALNCPDDAGTVAYKIRPDRHAIFPEDWAAYIRFASVKFGL